MNETRDDTYPIASSPETAGSKTIGDHADTSCSGAPDSERDYMHNLEVEIT